MRHLSVIDSIINVSVALACASAFFILPGLGTSGWLRQPFYILLAVAGLGFLVKCALLPTYRGAARRVLGVYGIPFAFFIVFTGFNLFSFALTNQLRTSALFSMDFYRTLSLILFFIIVVSQAQFGWPHLKWLSRSWLIPLVLTPALFINDIASVSQHQRIPFFGAYKLQGFQSDDATALSTWLIITFSLCVTSFFNTHYNRFRRILFGLASVVTMSLIWWSNSRGALIVAIVILLVVSVVNCHARHIRPLMAVFLSFFIFITGFIVLPHQAKTGVFVRFYPQYYGAAMDQHFRVSADSIAKGVFSAAPNFTGAQNRGELWKPCPRDILAHPLGEFGPELFSSPRPCGQHNSLFQAAFWGGWVALAVIGWFFTHVLRVGIGLIRVGPMDTVSLWLTLAFGGVLFQALLNSFLQLKPLWIIAAMLVAYEFSRKHNMESF